MLEVVDLVKTLPNGKALLRGISFTVSKGEFLSILGPSGAGKSLTMRCLNGLMKPTSGEVWLTETTGNKASITRSKGKELRRIRRKIGVIFQGFHLVGRLTAIENVMIGRLGNITPWRSILMGFTNEEAEEAMVALDQVKIQDLAFRKVNTFSGGEMQRVAIARAIYQRPDIILADEPIANLDPGNAANIMKLLQPLAERIPVLGVFHQPEMAADYCTRTIAIKAGKVIYDGKPQLSHSQLRDIYGEELKELAGGSIFAE